MPLAAGVLAMAALRLPLATPKILLPASLQALPAVPQIPLQTPWLPPLPLPSAKTMLQPKAEHPSALQPPCATDPL